MSLDPVTGESESALRALAQLRWLDGVLQQAWAPLYGGAVQWRDVPTVAAPSAGQTLPAETSENVK